MKRTRRVLVFAFCFLRSRLVLRTMTLGSIKPVHLRWCRAYQLRNRLAERTWIRCPSEVLVEPAAGRLRRRPGAGVSRKQVWAKDAVLGRASRRLAGTSAAPGDSHNRKWSFRQPVEHGPYQLRTARIRIRLFSSEVLDEQT